MSTSTRPDQARAIAHYTAMAAEATRHATAAQLYEALAQLVHASSTALAGSPALLNAQAALDAARPPIPVPDVADSDFGAFEAAGGHA